MSADSSGAFRFPWKQPRRFLPTVTHDVTVLRHNWIGRSQDRDRARIRLCRSKSCRSQWLVLLAGEECHYGRDWLSALLNQDPRDIKDFADEVGAHPESISALHRKLKRLEKLTLNILQKHLKLLIKLLVQLKR